MGKTMLSPHFNQISKYNIGIAPVTQKFDANQNLATVQALTGQNGQGSGVINSFLQAKSILRSRQNQSMTKTYVFG